jgi:VWFA-related protein
MAIPRLSGMHPLRFSLAATAAFLLPLTLQAQHPTLQTAPADKPVPATAPASSTGPATLSVDARLVNLPVVVRDTKGALVQNLTKADFTLQVDGHPQTIRYFDIDNNLPLTLGLLVDTSESQRNAIDDERTASSAFLDQMLSGNKDQAFVVQFARSIELLQDLTTSRPKLQVALKDLDTPAPAPRSSDPDDNSSNSRARTGGTALYDAVFLASDEITSKQKGRKALIVLTDGVDRNSKERLTDAIEASQRADTIIYAIYFKGAQPSQQNNNPGGNRGGGFPGGRGGGFPGGGGYPGGGGGYPGGGGRGGNNPSNRLPENHTDGKKILERMAQETGGRMFEVSKKQPVADIYAEIGKELRAQYRLGYTPDATAAGDGYHQIDLSLSGSDKKKYTIQTRDGYYTGK